MTGRPSTLHGAKVPDAQFWYDFVGAGALSVAPLVYVLLYQLSDTLARKAFRVAFREIEAFASPVVQLNPEFNSSTNWVATFCGTTSGLHVTVHLNRKVNAWPRFPGMTSIEFSIRVSPRLYHPSDKSCRVPYIGHKRYSTEAFLGSLVMCIETAEKLSGD